ETLAEKGEALRDLVARDDVDRGEGGGHGRGVAPVAAGEEDAAGGGFVRRAADAGGDGVAVGEGFAVDSEVGLVAVNGVGAVGGEAEAAADVVEDLEGAVFAAKAVAGGDEFGGGQLGVGEGGVV